MTASSVTEHEAERLFELIRELKQQGVVIIFITHKLEEVFAVSDKITVLRDGQYVGTEKIADVDTHTLVKMMIGRETENISYGVLDVDDSTPVVEARNLYTQDKAHDASFTLHQGEILGFYGLVGAGRTETARLLIGEDMLSSGEINIKGRPARIKSVADSLYRYNMGYVTENRKGEGLLLESTVKTSVAITIWNKIKHKVFHAISPSQETAKAQDMIDALAIKVTSVDQITDNLGGGNQQKVSISKWLAAGCDILIIDDTKASGEG